MHYFHSRSGWWRSGGGRRSLSYRRWSERARVGRLASPRSQPAAYLRYHLKTTEHNSRADSTGALYMYIIMRVGVHAYMYMILSNARLVPPMSSAIMYATHNTYGALNGHRTLTRCCGYTFSSQHTCSYGQVQTRLLRVITTTCTLC